MTNAPAGTQATWTIEGQKQLFGHPVGLYVLFATEMWERFSYYGMRALLVLYMTKHLFLPEHEGGVVGHHAMVRIIESIFGPQTPQTLASQMYGLYTALVYLTPVIGGVLADQFFGQRRTVIVGGVLMAIGHFLMAFSSLFYPALFFLILGNGAFKPNISTQVGGLYPKGDPRRDGAFNIFYVGINLGAFLSSLVCGTLGEVYGWHWGFDAAGVGMVLGLVIYIWGQKYLAPDNVMKKKEKTKDVAVEVDQASPYRSPAKVVTPAKKADERRKVLALCILCALNIPFWAVYEQQGNTLELWADGNSDRHLFAFLGWNWEMPATWFQSVNPAFIFMMTPLLNQLWLRQAKKKTEPSSASKMAIGCVLLGLSYFVMIGAARVYATGALASFWWLVGCTFIATVGEIYLSPVGLSLVTKISPPRIVSLMMGMWLLSSFFGNYMSGFLGTYWEKMSKESFFLMMAGICLATGVLMVAFYAPLKRAIGDENAADDPSEAPEPAEPAPG